MVMVQNTPRDQFQGDQVTAPVSYVTASAGAIINGYVSGESQPRVIILTNGMDLGPGGSTVVDTQWRRQGVNFIGSATVGMVGATAGPTTARQHTLPNVTSDTFGLLVATQTFTNKTLTSPALSGTTSGTYTLGGTITIGGYTQTGVITSSGASISGSWGGNPGFSGTVNFTSASPITFTAGAAVTIGTTDSNTFAIQTNGATRWTFAAASSSLTAAGVATIAFPANTAAALVISDGSTALITIDTRSATTSNGRNFIYIQPVAQTSTNFHSRAFNIEATTLSYSNNTTDTDIIGWFQVGQLTISNAGVKTVNMYALYFGNTPTCTTNITLTDSIVFYAANGAAATGTLTNTYGLYVQALTRGTNNYGIYINTPTGTIAEAIHTVGGVVNLAVTPALANAFLVSNGTTTMAAVSTAVTSAAGITQWAFTALNNTITGTSAARFDVPFVFTGPTVTLSTTNAQTSPWGTVTVTGLAIAQSGGAVTVSTIFGIGITPTVPSATVTLTDSSGFYVSNPGAATGTLTNTYGLYVEALTRGVNNYGIFINTPTGTVAESIHVAGGNVTLIASVGVGAAPFSTQPTSSIGVAGGVMIGTNTLSSLLDDATNGIASSAMFIGTGQITVVSDARIKYDRRPYQDNASAILNALPIEEFFYKEGKAPFNDGYGGRHVGFTAQELFKLAPWTVNTQGGRDCRTCLEGRPCDLHLPWQARYELLNGVIIKGWKEHDVRLTDDERELADLKSRVSILEERLKANAA